MAAIIVVLECITNMHVGNGDINYNIIDNEVERDFVTGYPVIHSSGVKGALREYFLKNPTDLVNINKVFGSDERKNNTQGKLKILNADMLAIPARAAKGPDAYYLISTRESVENYKKKCSIFLNKEIDIIYEDVSGKSVEGIELVKKTSVLKKDIYMIDESSFRKIPLPVLARNKLDNGESTHLWYEEVVPHESLFIFPVAADDADQEYLDKFAEAVSHKVIQFGGNASIGYGLCNVSVLGV